MLCGIQTARPQCRRPGATGPFTGVESREGSGFVHDIPAAHLIAAPVQSIVRVVAAGPFKSGWHGRCTKLGLC